MKFHVITFGCQMNVGDSDWLARSLGARGGVQVPEAEADVFLVNTCSVREKPEQKVYSLLGRLEDEHGRRREILIGVGGCVAQQVGRGLFDRFSSVRLAFGADGVAMVPAALERLRREPNLRISLLDFQEEYAERGEAPGESAPVQAFVNIMQGCDNFCAYCIVPYVRGRQKSRRAEAVLAECRSLVERGTREITLLGQNVNSYGLDKAGDGTTFSELLRRVAALPGLERLRFTTSHPKDLADDVAAAFGELDNLCPALHLPLQSGSDRILRLMGRRYDLAGYLAKVAALRRARPEVALTTDLIVGFPGETEADFQATLRAMEAVGFESSFSFKYCDRPGVKAALLPDQVPEPVKAERLARLQETQDRLTAASLAARVGSVGAVLVEGPGRMGVNGPQWRGRDEAGRVVNFEWPGGDPVGFQAKRHPAGLTGQLVPVRVTEAKKHSLLGEATGEPW